jgi:hypothetical protein
MASSLREVSEGKGGEVVGDAVWKGGAGMSTVEPENEIVDEPLTLEEAKVERWLEEMMSIAEQVKRIAGLLEQLVPKEKR